MSSLEEYEKILAGLKEKGADKFIDENFKNDISCFCSDDKKTEEIEEYDFIRGKRMAHFTDEEGFLEIDTSKASPLDVCESKNNIGLISVIQVLAEDSQIIDKIFLKRDQTDIGIYAL